MSITYTKPDTESSVEALARLWLNERAQRDSGKAELIADAYRRGIAEGIAALLFLERGEALKYFETIPGLYEGDVRIVLTSVKDEWKNASGEEKKELIKQILDSLFELVVPEDLKNENEQRRRRAILEGKEQALPTDSAWLAEAVEAKRRELEELARLLSPASS